MGGNALKGSNTRRYKKDEYFLLEKEVLQKIKSIFPGIKVSTIPAYHSKESFGDMDIVVGSSEIPSNLTEILVSEFNSKEVYRNSQYISFEYKEFQIDLIFVDASDVESAVTYFAFNDLSNLIGRVYHKFGLKYGERGLLLPVRTSIDHVHEEILVSKDTKKIMEFGGFSYERYCKGFDTLEDIFDFTASSKYFNPDIYLLDNRNAKARMRDSKRPTYMKFLKYCESLVVENPFKFKENKEEYLPMIFEEFSSVHEKWNSVLARVEEDRVCHEKYNGNIVRELLSIDGKELGSWMKNNREKFTREFVLYTTPDDIRSIIVKLGI